MNASPEDRVLEAVLCLVAKRAGRAPSTVQVSVKTDTGFRYSICVPAIHNVPTAPTPAPSPGTSVFQGCPREIIDTLREVGHRLTATHLLAEMERRGYGRSDTAIKTAAGTMVDMGALTNETSANPRGYGLPEWADS